MCKDFFLELCQGEGYIQSRRSDIKSKKGSKAPCRVSPNDLKSAILFKLYAPTITVWGCRTACPGIFVCGPCGGRLCEWSWGKTKTHQANIVFSTISTHAGHITYVLRSGVHWEGGTWDQFQFPCQVLESLRWWFAQKDRGWGPFTFYPVQTHHIQDLAD